MAATACWRIATLIVCALFTVIENTSIFQHVCHNSSLNDELAFVPPIGEEKFPKSNTLMAIQNRRIFSCCATGFDRISWKVNGSTPRQETDQYFLYQDNQLFSLESLPQGRTYLECKIHNPAGRTKRFRYKITSQDPGLKLTHYKPHFTITPKDQCLKPGVNVTWRCQAQFDGKSPCVVSERASGLGTTFTDLTYLQPDILQSENLRGHDVCGDTVESVFHITNIPGRLLDMNYSCNFGQQQNPRTFFSLMKYPCDGQAESQEKKVYYDSKTATYISAPVLGIVFIAFMVATLVIIYNPEARIWWSKKVMTNFFTLGNKEIYDIFMVYADADEDHLSELVEKLEQRYLLCLPERDFELGSVIPQETVEKLKSSTIALVAISNQVFVQDCWADTQIQMTLKVNKPVYFIRLEELSRKELDSRTALRAGLKICRSIEYPRTVDDSKGVDAFIENLFKLLPLPKGRAKFCGTTVSH